MKIPFTGGCACGAIRYESIAEPVMMLHCHCRDCQRASGGPFSSFVIVPAEAFKLLQGSPRFHASPSERGGMTRRGFCRTAAGRLWSNLTPCLNLSRSELRAWMTQAGSNRKQMCGQQTRIRGTKWIARCPSLRNIQRSRRLSGQDSCADREGMRENTEISDHL